MDLKTLREIAKSETTFRSMSPEEMEDTRTMIQEWSETGLKLCHEMDHVFDAVRAFLHADSRVETDRAQDEYAQDAMNVGIAMGIEIGKEMANNERKDA